MNTKTVFSAAAVLAAACLSANADVVVTNNQTVAFLGDSITEFGNWPAGYVNMVMKGLEVAGVRGVKKIPAGISGHKSDQMLARLDRDVLARADRRRADWMTLSCGVNDVWHQDFGKGVKLEDYKANIAAILDRCAASNVNVIVLTATMCGEDPAAKKNVMLDGYNDWLKGEAKRRGLIIADLNADMKAELAEIRRTDRTPGNKLTRDGVHMAYAGNCMMAWGVLKAMGVDESKKAAVYAAWKKLPAAMTAKLDFTMEEAETLLAKSPALGLEGLVRNYLRTGSWPEPTGKSWCALGTSITWYDANVGASGGRFTRGYQSRVMEKLGFTAYANCGCNGGVVKTQWGNVKFGDVYTIEHGVNDWGHSVVPGTIDDYVSGATNGTYAANYRVLIDRVRAVNPKATIVLCTPRKAYGFGTYLPKSASEAKKGIYLEDYAKVVRAIAEKEGFEVADFYAECGENDELAALSIDVALHPNDPGYQRMADCLVKAMKRALK